VSTEQIRICENGRLTSGVVFRVVLQGVDVKDKISDFCYAYLEPSNYPLIPLGAKTIYSLRTHNFQDYTALTLLADAFDPYNSLVKPEMKRTNEP